MTAFRLHLALLVTCLMLTVLDYMILALIDNLLLKYVPGYSSTDSLITAVVIFFFAVYGLCYQGLMYGWQKIVPYVIYGTAVFFPLIFVTSLVRFFVGLPENLDHFYRFSYCADNVLCGPALAHMVFCSSIRTLPLLLIIPAAFYGLLKINFLGLANPKPR